MLHTTKAQTTAFIAVFFICSITSNAQTTLQKILQQTNLHIGLGYCNYGGDLQEKKYTLKQAGFARNVGLSYNLSNRLRVVGEYTFGKIQANDKLNKSVSLQQRNLNFKANLFETALTFQYDFIEEQKYGLVPYIYAGVAYFKASPYTYYNGTIIFLSGLHTEGVRLNQLTQYSSKHISIPFGVGLRMKLNNVFSVNYELGFRKTFTDYIDDVSSTYANITLLSPLSAALAYRGTEIKADAIYPTAGSIRGNSNKKDYYYFGLIKLQASLGFLVNKNLHCPKKVY